MEFEDGSKIEGNDGIPEENQVVIKVILYFFDPLIWEYFLSSVLKISFNPVLKSYMIIYLQNNYVLIYIISICN